MRPAVRPLAMLYVNTTSDNAVTVISDPGLGVDHLRIINASASKGFFSVAGGDWCYLPDSATVVLDGLDGGIDPAEGTPLLRVKRVPSGANLSVYAYAWR